MDAFNQAQEKKWIRAKGVSCHTLPALRAGGRGGLVGGASGARESAGQLHRPRGEQLGQRRPDIAPVMQQIKIMHAKGRGVIGMKICGNGTFTDPADREKSIRFAMSQQGN